MSFRTDANSNPTAMTTDVALEGGLKLGVDYQVGSGFLSGLHRLYTAKFLGDPIALTIRVLDSIGFYTESGALRWDYVGIPKPLWDELSIAQKISVIGFMYHREGGTTMSNLFSQESQSMKQIEIIPAIQELQKRLESVESHLGFKKPEPAAPETHSVHIQTVKIPNPPAK